LVTGQYHADPPLKNVSYQPAATYGEHSSFDSENKVAIYQL